MEIPDCKYYPRAGYIGGPDWILYESDSIRDLTPKARRRLAEIENEHRNDPLFNYEAAEKILIAEGLI